MLINGIQEIEQLLLVLTLLVLGFYEAERMLKCLLSKYGFQDIHESNLHKGQYTRQACIVSLIVTGLLTLGAMQEHIFSTTDIPCEYIDTYDTRKTVIQCIVLLGYFIYDAMFHELKRDFLLHHVIGGIVITLITLGQNSYGIYFAGMVMVVELSSVPLNLIHITSGATQVFFKYVFALSFTLVRPVYMSFILKKMIECQPNTMIGYTGVAFFVGLYLLNLFWFYKLCLKMHRESRTNVIQKKTE
jgi:hypothetical protein